MQLSDVATDAERAINRAVKAREESRGHARPSGIIRYGGQLHERQPGIAGEPANAFRFREFRLNSD